MSMVKEFKEFAFKGNVVDLAVGVIIGAAFGKVVSSFVSDLVMPPLGLLMGSVDFKALSMTLRAADGTRPALLLTYGAFAQTVFDFLLVALAVFSAIKLMNQAKRAEPPPPVPPAEIPKQELLLAEIRDLLKAQTKS